MTLPASGAISLFDVNDELGLSHSAQIGLLCTNVRTLFAVASGAVGMTTGYGKSNTSVPGVPTGVSASASSSSAISVSFSAPGCTGHLAIDYYQAVCTSSGTNSATGSSPISVTGLSASTAYTFKVRAHNSKGYGCYSSSTGTATTQAPTGSVSFTSPGCYSWTVPAGVTSISVLAISGGTAGSVAGVCHIGPYYDCYGRLSYDVDMFYAAQGGRGGGAGWRNNFSVTPGQTLYVKVAHKAVGYGCQYGNYYSDDSYVTTSRNNSTYGTYYYSAWKNAIVLPQAQGDSYVQSNFGMGVQPPCNVGTLTNGYHPNSRQSEGGVGGTTYRGTYNYSYYGGSGPCASHSSGGGGGGGPNLICATNSTSYPWALSLDYSAGHGASTETGAATGNSSAGGSGGALGSPGQGSGALCGSGSSPGGCIGQGGYGANAVSSGRVSSGNTNNNSGSGAVRIVWPGSTRAWPNTGVNYGC